MISNPSVSYADSSLYTREPWGMRKGDEVLKHGKKPTRSQRLLMQKWKLNSQDWLVVKDEPTRMTLVHRHFDYKTKIIPKGGREDG